MDNAQVAVADYRPDWWPANTSLLIRRARLDPGQVSADPRSRRRRTLHPVQRALPIAWLEDAGAIYAYSFILTNLDVSAPGKAAAAEHWYRHRTTIESIFRDSKHGAALRHLPSGYAQVNTAWMWGALLAASMAGWLHQLTAATRGQTILAGHGVPRRQGDDRDPAVAADRRPRPAGPPRRAAHPAAPAPRSPARRDPRPPPGPSRAVLTSPARKAPTGKREPGLQACPHPRNPGRKDKQPFRRSTQRANRGIGSDCPARGHRVKCALRHR
jgi:hypothetical protein